MGKLEENLIQKYQDKVNELRQQIPEEGDSPVVEFGYSTIRHGGKEIFRIVDFGNIGKFIRQELLSYRREIEKELIEKINEFNKLLVYKLKIKTNQDH